jgi:hypothetical protein
MRFSSLFTTGSAVAAASFVVLLSSTAMSQPTTPAAGATTELPGVVVEPPKHVARLPKPHAVVRSSASVQAPSATPTPSASPVMAELAKLASETSSCAGGCQSSFKSGSNPWVGCSVSSGVYSSTCRNTGNFKTYDQCQTAAKVMGWRSNEYGWYCTSLALK